MSGHIRQPPNGASARRRSVPVRDARSDWRRWSGPERVGAVAIALAWLGTVSSVLAIGVG